MNSEHLKIMLPKMHASGWKHIIHTHIDSIIARYCILIHVTIIGKYISPADSLDMNTYCTS